MKHTLPVKNYIEMVSQKIKSLKEVVRLREQLRESNKRLVFTNGCFDILHVGHIRYLNQARTFGDVLVVAVNSDRSVETIKGPARPIVPESERMEVLAALTCVDWVLLFDEPTPQRMIEAIAPDVLVKGSDWELSDVVGRDTVESSGGSVLTVPLVEGSSTTNLIATVLDRFGPPS